MTDSVLVSALSDASPTQDVDVTSEVFLASSSSVRPRTAVSTGKSLPFARTDSVNAHSEYLGRFAGLIYEGLIDESMRRSLDFAQEHCHVCESWLHTLREAQLKKSARYYQVYWEYRIWLLLSILYDVSAKNEPFSVDKYQHFYDDKRMVESYLSKEEECVVMDCLLEWLESTAESVDYMKQGNVSFSRTRGMPAESRHPCLRESVDMDSFIRNDIDPWKLSKEERRDIDAEDEFLHTICRLIRRGRWNDIDEVCEKFGQTWRSASFAGRKLVSMNDDGSSSTEMTGNSMYLIWLETCRRLAEKSKSERESWIYSALCGDPHSLVDDCHHWEDLLWSLLHCRKLKLIRETMIQSMSKESGNWNSKFNNINNLHFSDHSIIQSNSNNNILDDEWNERLSSNEKVFECVDSTLTVTSSSDRRLKLELQYYKIVKCISKCWFDRGRKVMKCLDDLIIDAESFISMNSTEMIPLDYIRLLIHLYMSLSTNTNDDSSTNVSSKLISWYIRGLAQSEQYSLASVYCSILSSPMLIKCYGQFLTELKDERQTVYLLSQARDNGIFKSKEVAALAREVVNGDVVKQGSSTRAITGSNGNGRNSNNWEDLQRPMKMTSSDMERIKAVELMSLEDRLLRVNVLFCELAMQYKEQGCCELSRVMNESKVSEEIEKEVEQLPYLRPHLKCLHSWFVFSEVVEWIETWDCYQRRCHSTSAVHSHSDHSSLMMKMDDTTEEETLRSLFDCVLRLLTVPNGWLHPLLCPIEEYDTTQMSHIRGVLLFRVLYRVCRIANLTGHFDDCLKLIHLLADEQYDLHSSLSAHHLKTLLCVAQEADLQILTTFSVS